MSTTPAFKLGTSSPPAATVPRVCLSPRETALALGISEGTLAMWLRQRSGPPSFVAPGGRLRLFPVASLQEWAAAQARDAEGC